MDVAGAQTSSAEALLALWDPVSNAMTVLTPAARAQAGIKVAIGGKPTMTTLVDMNTLTLVSPAVSTGPQQLTLSNVNGEPVIEDAVVIAN